MSPIYTIDPTNDSRWREFVDRHPDASVFHTVGWLEALRTTYGYQPAAITTSAPGSPLSNGIVYCRVNSWLTGRRLVSLPFSDHCEPLFDGNDSRDELLPALSRAVADEGLKYFEIRPLKMPAHPSCPRPSDHFCFHALDLRPPLEKIWAGFHKDCVQRKIRKAEKESLEIRTGRSGQILEDFYSMQKATRRRQGAPVQSKAWFRNLSECMGDKLKIRAAYKNGLPLAAILTLSHGNRCVFKYACSDSKYNALGGIQLLLWQVIRDAREAGAQELDLGRSDPGHAGLVAFKDRWGAARADITYLRDRGGEGRDVSALQRKLAASGLTRLPFKLFPFLGTALYRHFG